MFPHLRSGYLGMTTTLKLHDTYLDANLPVGPCPIEVERHKTDRYDRDIASFWSINASCSFPAREELVASF